jgi:U3 small nucleolar RNA-associated protein 16
MVTTRGGTETSSPPLAKKRAPQDDQAMSPVAKRIKPTTSTKDENPVTVAQVPIRSKVELEPELEEPEATPVVPRTHIRFGSTSPPPQIDAPVIATSQIRLLEEDIEESDDDAAPEDISHSVAQEQAFATQAVASKALHEQKAAKKQRRRKRDKKLKEQVEGSEKRKEKAVTEKENEDGEEDIVEKDGAAMEERKPVDTSKKFTLDNIPALLPDELLATEAPIRPPTPPPATLRQQHKQIQTPRSSYLSTAPLKIPQPKPPKDLTIGTLNVRVVEASNSLLPPRVNENSANIRSNWLRGRSEIAARSSRKKKSFKDHSRVQRREIGGSRNDFV